MTKKKYFRKIIKRILAAFALLLILLVLFIFSVYTGMWGSVPSEKALTQLSNNKASEIYDAKNRLIGKFYVENRQPLPYDSIPKPVIEALIATEDIRFYEHNGVDTRSFLRVLVKSLLLQNSSSGGGSTLTQQLAKNLFSREDRGLMTLPVAKTKEIIIARRLENIYDKNKILELYLNTVPFSGNTKGIESASRKYFNKPAKDLRVAQAATLIGTLKATSYYNPARYPDRAIQRRNVVLGQMLKYKKIDKAQFQKFTADSLTLDYGNYDEQEGIAPHFREVLRQKLLKWCEDQSSNGNLLNLYTSGLKIYTTIDKDLQIAAENATTSHLSQLQAQMEAEYAINAPWSTGSQLLKAQLTETSWYQKLKNQGLEQEAIIKTLSNKESLMTVSGKDGEMTRLSIIDSLKYQLKKIQTGTLVLGKNGSVKAYVGGDDFSNFKYDHIQSKRQVGSTFKPIVYAAYLEKGNTPCDYISARRISYKNLNGWSPENQGDKDERYLNYSLKEALTHSINTVSVKVLEDVGIAEVISLSRKLNIKSELPEVPSLALGTGELSPREMAGAYAALINDGKPVEPFYLKQIDDFNGSVIEKFEEPKVLDAAISEETRQYIINMMQSVVDDGTASRLRKQYGLRNNIAAKTGTTQSNKDAYFMAVTPDLIFATWVGFDNHRIGFKSTRVGQGANAALPITGKILQEINNNPDLSQYSNSRFMDMNTEFLKNTTCPPTKRDGFFKRLFTNPDKKKKRRFKRD